MENRLFYFEPFPSGIIFVPKIISLCWAPMTPDSNLSTYAHIKRAKVENKKNYKFPESLVSFVGLEGS